MSMRPLLNALLYFPSRTIVGTPADVRDEVEERTRELQHTHSQLLHAEKLSAMTPLEADFLKAMAADSTERLACQCRVMGDATLEVEEF